MKALISFFLIFSHLFSTVGFIMEVHECAGEKSYSIFGLSLTSLCECDHDSHKHDDNCCKDKKVQVKADHKDKITVKAFYQKHFLDVFILPKQQFFVSETQALTQPKSFAFGTEYPPDHSPPLYLLYNVFLI
ncbi:MAG: hypothetical protein IPI46_09945 [Bacteroidetes bacterium]|nr:hypothetical protein [Bacteroidota bacterium]